MLSASMVRLQNRKIRRDPEMILTAFCNKVARLVVLVRFHE